MNAEHELVGRVWDQWGALTPRAKRRITRRHPRLAKVLDEIERHVTADLANAWEEIHGRTGGR